MRKIGIKETQKVLFEMLCALTDYCDRKDISYSLCGGTLLGAVRHKGFIPWDDDTDIFMSRNDYVKLHDCLKKEQIAPHLKFKSLEMGNSVCPTARLVNMNTLTRSEYMDFGDHLFIDIFPVDGLPKKKSDAVKYLNNAEKIKKIYYLSIANVGSGKTKFRAIAKVPAVILAKLVSTKTIVTYFDKYVKRYDFDSSNYVGAVASSCGERELFKKKDFISVKEYVFNGRFFHGISDAHSYLTRMFGDYMKLPRKEDRKKHYEAVFLFD